MTSGEPEKTGEVRQEVPGPQEDIDFRDQKKAPKQASKSVNRKILRGRHLVWVQSLEGRRHTPARALLFPIDTQRLYIRTSCVCACMFVSLSLCHFVCLAIHIAGVINFPLECLLYWLHRLLLCMQECYCFNRYRRLSDHAETPKQTPRSSNVAAWLELDAFHTDSHVKVSSEWKKSGWKKRRKRIIRNQRKHSVSSLISKSLD